LRAIAVPVERTAIAARTLPDFDDLLATQADMTIAKGAQSVFTYLAETPPSSKLTGETLEERRPFVQTIIGERGRALATSNLEIINTAADHFQQMAAR
jgi:hypothetical protein